MPVHAGRSGAAAAPVRDENRVKGTVASGRGMSGFATFCKAFKEERVQDAPLAWGCSSGVGKGLPRPEETKALI